MTSSASPTVRRRRLAVELRRLRGGRTGTTVAKALGWSAAKVSRYELGQGTFPLEEIEKLLDYYGVTDPRRAQLLALAVEANERGWWYDYADALTPEYMELIGIEAEAVSELAWQVVAVPGLLQTEAYARAVHTAHQQVVLMPPGIFERRVAVRMIRQQVLTTRNPPLELSAVMDESVILRMVGSEKVMFEQLLHLVEVSRLPNVEPANPAPGERDVADGGFVPRVRVQFGRRDCKARRCCQHRGCNGRTSHRRRDWHI